MLGLVEALVAVCRGQLPWQQATCASRSNGLSLVGGGRHVSSGGFVIIRPSVLAEFDLVSGRVLEIFLSLL